MEYPPTWVRINEVRCPTVSSFICNILAQNPYIGSLGANDGKSDLMITIFKKFDIPDMDFHWFAVNFNVFPGQFVQTDAIYFFRQKTWAAFA